MGSNSSTRVLNLEQDEVLFYEGDAADSLFIIQRGQLRLYRPKGQSTVEIAVVRQGEVLGEMAYFDPNITSRSCSASAMVGCEIIEIPFEAFKKTIKDLSPWLKTIIMTLVERLKKANTRIKALDSNSASFNYKTGQDDAFTMVKPTEVSKILATIFLALKSHSAPELAKKMVNKSTLFLYANDIYGINESKLEHLLLLLKQLGYLAFVQDGKNDLIACEDIDLLKSMLILYNTERHLTEDKKIIVSRRCCLLLEKVWDKCKHSDAAEGEMVKVKINQIMQGDENTKYTIEDFNDGIKHDFVDDVLVDEDEVSIPVNFHRLKKYLPLLRLMRVLAERA